MILPDPVNTAIVDRGIIEMIRKDESNLHIQFIVYLVFYPHLPGRILNCNLVGLNNFPRFSKQNGPSF